MATKKSKLTASEKILHKKQNFDTNHSLLIGIIFFIALLLISTNIILSSYGQKFSVFSVFVWIVIFGIFIFLPSITKTLTRTHKVILKKRINAFILMVLFFVLLFVLLPFVFYDLVLGISLFIFVYFFVFIYFTRNAKHKKVKKSHKLAEYYIYSLFGGLLLFGLLYLLYLLLNLLHVTTIQTWLIYMSLLIFWIFNDFVLRFTRYYEEQEKLAKEIDDFDRKEL